MSGATGNLKNHDRIVRDKGICGGEPVFKGTRVTLRGTRWELSRRQLPPGSRGLSNVLERELALTVHGGAAALVFPEASHSGSENVHRRSRPQRENG